MQIMVDVWLPYNKTEVVVRISDQNLLGVINSRVVKSMENPVDEVNRAIRNPIDGKRLDAIVKPGKKVAIVIDDNTRPTPSHIMILSLLTTLNQLGVKDDDITVIVGCGMHNMAISQLPFLLDDYSLHRVNVIIHDCYAPDLVYVGETSFGTKLYVNRIFAEADIRILTGDIGLHYYAGYGGGRKSVLPAVCGVETIQRNHSYLLDSKAKTGNMKDNPIHMDMEEAAHLAGVDFILNVVLNSQKRVVKAFAGDLDQAFLEGVKLVDALYKVPVNDKAEIVIVSPGGFPMDLNLYQAYKGIDSALNVVKDGGEIILVADCAEGYGNEVFYDWMVKFQNLKRIEREIRRRFMVGGHKAYYIVKALEKAKITLVSTLPDYYTSGVFRLRAAKTVNVALDSAFQRLGKDSKVFIIPHGAATLPLTTE